MNFGGGSGGKHRSAAGQALSSEAHNFNGINVSTDFLDNDYHRAAAKGGQVGHTVNAGQVDHAASSGDHNAHITKSPDAEDGEWKTINGAHVWITSRGDMRPFPGSQGFGM